MAWETMGGVLDRLRRRKENKSFDRSLSESEAVGAWPEAVGATIAKHSRALGIRSGVLLVQVDHPVWKNELHARKLQIIENVNARIRGEFNVKDIQFI